MPRPTAGISSGSSAAFVTYEDSGNRQVILPQDLNGDVIGALQPFYSDSLPTTFKEYALFGNASYKLTEALELSAGARIAQQRLTYDELGFGYLLVGDPVSIFTGHIATDSDVFTYSASAKYAFDEQTMAYVRIASGYRPGGPNYVWPDVPESYGPDRVLNSKRACARIPRPRPR